MSQERNCHVCLIFACLFSFFLFYFLKSLEPGVLAYACSWETEVVGSPAAETDPVSGKQVTRHCPCTLNESSADPV